MSSYLDNPQVLGNFSPYVQQLPVDAMVKVGMQRQAQYNEGVQRIQSSIDNIAGLDVVRDVDKQYLQSKLNDLGENLKTVAAGDFSNFQLQNSVGGMVGKIAKDENVRNAVSSTKHYQKQLSIIEEARKKGESSLENEFDFTQKANKWLSTNTPGEKFTDQYTPYIDVNKKLVEVAKSVGVDEKIIPELFKTDGGGNWILDKNNLPQFNNVMVEKHLKGKDPAKLLAAFYNSLTPADYNQLAITGRYVNGGKDSEQLKQTIKNNYSQQLSSVDAKLNELKIRKTELEGVKSPDATKIKSLADQIEIFEKQKEKFSTSLEDDLKKVDISPDSVRASLYTNSYIAGMSKQLSEISEITEVKVSPYFDVEMKLKQFDLEQQKFRQSVSQSDRDYALKVRQQLFEENKNKGDGTGGGVDLPVETEGVDRVSVMNKRKDDFSQKMQRRDEIDATLAIESYNNPNILPRKAGEDSRSYQSRVMKQIEQDASSRGMSTQDYIKKLAIEKVVNGVSDPRIKGIVDERRALDKQVVSEQLLIEGRQKRAIEEAKSKGLNVAEYKDMMKDIKPITVSLGGQSLTIPKDDVYKFVKANPNVFNTFGPMFKTKVEKEDEDAAKRDLERKYGNLLPEIVAQLFPTRSSYGSMAIVSNMELANLSKKLRDKDNDAIAKIEAEYYKDDDMFQGKSFEITKDKEDPIDYTNRIMNVVKASNNNLNETEFQNILSTAKSSRVIVLPGETGTDGFNYTLSIVPEKGKEINVPISAKNFTYLTKQIPLVSNTKPSVLTVLDEYGNSSLDGSGSSDMAWWTENDFSRLENTNFSAKGNLVSVVGDKDKFLFQIYLNGSSTPITVGDPISKWAKDANGNDIVGTYNPSIENLPQLVDETFIRNLLSIYNKNNK